MHFEIHASDPERAATFYRNVFDWEIVQWLETPPYWGVMTAPEGSQVPGINGGMLIRHGDAPEDGAPVNAYVCTVQVDSFDDVHDKIMGAGGTVALPKHAIPGIAWQGYYKDTEGNIFGVHQPDENAE